MPVQRLTQKDVDDLNDGGEPRLIRDTQVKGLMVVVGKKGASYKVQYDLYQERRYVRTVAKTLGATAQLKLKVAQRLARAVIDQIKAGVDPDADRSAARAGNAAPTVEQMFLAHATFLQTKKGAPDRTIKDMKYRRDK